MSTIGSARRGDLAPPAFDLGEPGTIEFTAERALAGQALNRFALSLRSPGGRTEFLADEPGYMRRFGLTATEIELVTDRNWTGLLLAGGHLHALLKLAATVGSDLWDIGAHNAGCGRDELIAATPRKVSGLPGTAGPAAGPARPAGPADGADIAGADIAGTGNR